MTQIHVATAQQDTKVRLTGTSGIFSIAQTLAGPHASGRWVGFQNFVGNFTGIIAPAAAGLIH